MLSLAKEVLSQNPLALVTKRGILSSTHKLFDPIGMVSPVALGPKILLQKLWGTAVDWDTPLEKDLQDYFRQWQEGLGSLEVVKISRWALEAQAILSHYTCLWMPVRMLTEQ